MYRRLAVVLAFTMLLLVPAAPGSAICKPQPCDGGGGGGAASGPSVHVSDVWVLEGDSGTANAMFTVWLSGPGVKVSVRAQTVNVTAIAGSDYTSVNTTVTFAGSEVSKTVSVPVVGDTLREGNENFRLVLSNPQNAALGDAQGDATISDEEGQIYITESDASLVEGNGGTTNMVFSVWLSHPPAAGQSVSVRYNTFDRVALAGVDYTAVDVILTFGPGETEKQVSVPIIGDTVDEENEIFGTHLSQSSAGSNIADSEGVGTIVDDDPLDTVGPSRWIYARNADTVEGESGSTDMVFEVYLSSAPGAGEEVRVTVATADVSAQAGSDYQAVPPTVLVFGPGELSKQVVVPIFGDLRGERGEEFLLNLSNAQGAEMADKRGRGWIVDEEGPYFIYVSSEYVTEGQSGTTTATFDVSLSRAIVAGDLVTVTVATANGTATAGSDYVAVAPTVLTFGAGEITKPVSVTILGDTAVEGAETFTVPLSANSTNTSSIGDNSGLGTILNDD